MEIGITVTPPSYVHIKIGDFHGKTIVLSPKMWKKLIQHKTDIISTMQRNDVDLSTVKPILIEHLTIRFGKINNLPVIRLDTSTTRLVMSLNSAIVMFDLECCINRIVKSLSEITSTVDEKFKRFLEIASNVKDKTKIPTTIRRSEFFNHNDIIDCELATLSFYM